MDTHQQAALEQVIAAFVDFLNQLDQVSELLAQETGPVWIQGGDRVLIQDRQAVIDVIRQIEYQDHQEGRETVVRPGLVGVSLTLLNQVKQLNQSKDTFKAQVLAFKESAKTSATIQFHHYINQRIDESPFLLRSTWRRQGFARLHVKQCYRHLPLLEAQPYQVSWTWTHTRSIQKLTLVEAESRLLKMPMDVGIAQQLQKLKLLSPSEHLAIVQDLSPHCCANIVLDEAKTQRKMLKSPIPIFYPIDSTLPVPTVIPPTTCREKNPERRERSDIKIEKEPYLPAIRAHRYFGGIIVPAESFSERH